MQTKPFHCFSNVRTCVSIGTRMANGAKTIKLKLICALVNVNGNACSGVGQRVSG